MTVVHLHQVHQRLYTGPQTSETADSVQTARRLTGKNTSIPLIPGIQVYLVIGIPGIILVI